ncbi:hypothetical protein MEQU1_001436 [Malassezia equina]|uniref:Uncharacterized protein n=1 Tax=Malassezia equina TaxID=1381935 RepID=A0AAF0ECP1_9BASI|nr:hypothetical protein MEQU1_001436 [Malassezia equina]
MGHSPLPWWPKTWNPFSRWHTTSHYDYETILSSLADEIKQVESTLLDIKARKRRAIYNVLQRTKINEIKRATDFDHLRALLDTYDTEAKQEASVPSTPSTPANQNRLLSRRSTTSLRRVTSKDVLRRHRKADSLQEKPRLEEDDVTPSLAPAITGLPIQGIQDGQCNPESRASIQTPDSSAPYPRSWMDKVADMILGTDPYGATLEDQQYALPTKEVGSSMERTITEESEPASETMHEADLRARPPTQPVGDGQADEAMQLDE